MNTNEARETDMPVPYTSFGTGGYNSSFNVYSPGGDMSCGGNTNEGKEETYKKKDDGSTDVAQCVHLCSVCAGCAGFEDIKTASKCSFKSTITLTNVTAFDSLAIVRKYLGMAKVFQPCRAGFYASAATTGEICTECEEGKYSTKGAAACIDCNLGR